MSFQGCSERLLRSVWVTSDPSCSRRSRSRSLAETTSRRPSGRKSMQNGNEGMRTMTSLLPSRSTAMISCAPQSENQRRSSCQRGDSPNAMPVIRICSSGTYSLLSSGTWVGQDSLVLMFEEYEMSATATKCRSRLSGYSSCGADLLCNLLEALKRSTGKEHFSPLAGEGAGDRTTDRPSVDNGALVLEQHIYPPRLVRALSSLGYVLRACADRA